MARNSFVAHLNPDFRKFIKRTLQIRKTPNKQLKLLTKALDTGVFKTLSNISDRAFLQNQLTAGSNNACYVLSAIDSCCTYESFSTSVGFFGKVRFYLTVIMRCNK